MARSIRTTRDSQKPVIDIFDSLAYRHSRWAVWTDFVAMAACSLSNLDKAQQPKREEMYLSIAKKYSRDDLEQFAAMFAAVVEALEEDCEQDFLGDLFMRLELGNEAHGQFFTPYHVCDFMAKMTFDDAAAEVERRGYISVNDPCCGAGALLVAFANECRRQEINFQTSVLFVAQDIDITAALMCYIQLSLLGCAGYVIIGNTLTTPPTEPLRNQNVWYTPMYFRDIWQWRAAIKATKHITGATEPPVNTEPVKAEKPVEKPTFTLELNTDKTGQITLF
jgi:Type I restriction-modification system methyltransferase subunit